ncbi:MAG TPA: T9SS type A sorting domain-containing protein, partial [Segetibacter sp.]
YAKQNPLTVNLFDNNGRRVATQIITSGQGEFNISKLPKGTYFVVAESNGVRVETKKIVKQ